MADSIKTIFERKLLSLPLDKLLPTREAKASDACFGKYATVLASIPTMGLVEPIAINPCRGKPGYYIVLDGHLRLKALKELKHETAWCMIATDDDTFTYNDKANRLSPIQEHRMIMRALEQGVTIEDVAGTLAIEARRVRESMGMLKGIHPEVVEKLKDKQVSPTTLRVVRKVKPLRQLEMADLMTAMSDYTAAYANALLLATPPDMLLQPEAPRVTRGLKPEEIGQMEREMENLERDFRLHQESYGENTLALNVIQRYVQRLIGNPAVKKFLGKRYPEIFEELSVVATMETL